MTDEMNPLGLTQPEIMTLIGVVQVEKKRARNRGDDAVVNDLGEIQQKLIENQ